MPADSAMTPLSWELVSTLPSWAREAPDYKAICHCAAKESERMQEMAQSIRDGFIPSRTGDPILGAWEQLFDLAPVAAELEEIRRAAFVGAYQRIVPDSRGSKTVRQLQAILGPAGWTYEENPAGDPYSVRLTVGWEPPYTALKARIRPIIPAHLEIDIVGIGGGFILDISEMDVTEFHFE